MTDSKKRKTDEEGKEAKEPKKSRPAEAAKTPAQEADTLTQEIKKGETLQVIPGVTVRSLFNMIIKPSAIKAGDLGGRGTDVAVWDELCSTAKGRRIALTLLTRLWDEHNQFVDTVQSCARSARMAVDDYAGDGNVEVNSKLDEVDGAILDIESAADSIGDDMNMVLVQATKELIESDL